MNNWQNKLANRTQHPLNTIVCLDVKRLLYPMKPLRKYNNIFITYIYIIYIKEKYFIGSANQ